MPDHTNGAPFVITQVEDLGEFSRRISYLFPDGSRRGVVVTQAEDSPELRDKLGEAWASGRVNLTRMSRR